MHETAGYVRVVNKRIDMAPDSQPEPDEVVILVDRNHPVLGNRHVLHNKNDIVARDRVIAAYGKDLNADFARQGPMFHAIKVIAERVAAGEKICLQCHCKPSKCHADLIADKVNQLVENPELAQPKKFRF